MKKYVKPEAEFVELEVNDIVATSGETAMYSIDVADVNVDTIQF